ncbi:unnamed protein product [Auanema sp. JU1783]|nr:unnamed protein product [Auanema sp. JU1783]
MKVRAKVISGRDESFEVSEEITVEQFRRLVSERISISSEKIRLLFQGRFLSDKAKTLAHYGVQDGFVIHVVEQMNHVNNMPVYADEVNQQRRRNTGGSYTNRRVLVPPVRSVITFTRGGAVTEPSRLQDLVRRAIDDLPIIPAEVRTGLRIDMTATGLTVNMPALNCPHVPSQALERIIAIDRVLKYMRFFRTSAEKDDGICSMIDSLLDSTHWPPDNIIKVTRGFLLNMDSFSDINMPTQEYENNDPESADYQGRYQSYPIPGNESNANMSPYIARHALASDLAKKHDELHEEYMKFQPHLKRYNYILSSHHVFNIEERDYLLTDPRANILCVYSQHVRKNLHKYSHALHILSELNVKLEDPLPRRLYPQNRVFQFSNPSQGQISFEIVDPHNPNRIETARHQTASDMFRCTTNEPTSFDGLISLFPTGYQRPQTLFSASRPTNNNRTLGGTRRPIIVDGQIESPPPITTGITTPHVTSSETGSDSQRRRRVFEISQLGTQRGSSRVPSSATSVLEGNNVPSERSSSARAPENRATAPFEHSLLAPLIPSVGEHMRTSNIPNRQSFADDYQILQNRTDPIIGLQNRTESHNVQSDTGAALTSDANTSSQPMDLPGRPYVAPEVVYPPHSPSLDYIGPIDLNDDHNELRRRLTEAVRSYQDNMEHVVAAHAILLENHFSLRATTARARDASNPFERLYRQIIDAGITNIGRSFGVNGLNRAMSELQTNPLSILLTIVHFAVADINLPEYLRSLPGENRQPAVNPTFPANLINAAAQSENRRTAETFLESLTSMLDGTTSPMVGGVEIRLEPHGFNRVIANHPRVTAQFDRDDAATPRPTVASLLPSELESHFATLREGGSQNRGGSGLPMMSMRQRVLRPDPSPDSPPIPLDPFLNCDSLLDFTGADSAVSGSMFHQISSSRMFNSSFRDSLSTRRRTNLPTEPYGVPTMAEIRMALTHNGEIISPSEEASVILIIQHAIRWILLLMRENDISRVEETAGRSRQIVGIRQLHDEMVAAHSDPEERFLNRASLFSQESLSTLMLNDLPDSEMGRLQDIYDNPHVIARNPSFDSASNAHLARNTGSSSRRLHALWTTPLRFDPNSSTPVYFQTNTNLPARAAPPTNPAVARIAVPLVQPSTMRMPPNIVGIASIRNSGSHGATTASTSPATAAMVAPGRSGPVRLTPSSIRIAVPVIGSTVRNLPSSDPSLTFAEQLARQVEENMRNMGASVSLLTNSRAGSPSSSTAQERPSNSREAITVRAPEQGTSPRAKKRKTETDTSSAPASSRALFNRSIPMNTVNRTSWERIVAADVERQRNSPPRVCTFSRGYLAGGYCARTVSSLPRSSSFTGIVDNLTHLSVDGFPESPMTQNLDFLDEPD